MIRIFPHRPAVIRLVGALLMESDEKWSRGKKQLDMAKGAEWFRDGTGTPPKVTKM